MSTQRLHAVPMHGALFGCHVRRLGATSVIELRGELDLAALEVVRSRRAR